MGYSPSLERGGGGGGRGELVGVTDSSSPTRARARLWRGVLKKEVDLDRLLVLYRSSRVQGELARMDNTLGYVK